MCVLFPFNPGDGAHEHPYSVLTFSRASTKPDFTLVGVFLISVALLADAVIGNVQVLLLNSWTPC